MNKSIYLIGCVLTALLCLAGCGASRPAITDSSELAGVWYGCGNALGKNSDFRADNLCLSIDDQGSLTLTDIEQNSDLLRGSISIDSSHVISITADTTFDSRLPQGWESFAGEEEFSYRAPDKGHLLLTYEDVSYYFARENVSMEEKATSVSPLLDIAETDIWYSAPRNEDDSSVYELALYDKYMELYYINPEEEAEGLFLTNFLYCGNDGEEFSFYTYRDDAMELPEVFDSLPDGLSEITIRLSVSNEALTLEYDGNSLSFYNNVIYGLNTSSTAYFLNDTSFYWNFDDTEHFCHFSTDEGTGQLCLFLSDGEAGDDSSNVICLEVSIDEAGQNILLDFNRSRSRMTADRASALFQYFKALEQEHGSPLRIPFRLKDTKLKLKARNIFGRNYTFRLEDYQTSDDTRLYRP